MDFDLINTGGTISSAVVDGIIVPGAVTEFLGKEGVPLYNMHSENFTLEHFKVIEDAIEESDNYVVVVTVGTDCIAHLAAYLSFSMFTRAIVLLSADKPISKGGNGLANIELAKHLILQPPPRGVYVPYLNPDGTGGIHYGTRILEPRQHDGAIFSAGNMYAKYTTGVLNIIAPDDYTPKLKPIKEYDDVYDITLEFCHPMLDYERILKHASETKSAVVFSGYHSGTANQYELAKFGDIPVFVAGGTDGVVYESQSDLDNVHFIPNITPVALFYKIQKYISICKCLGKHAHEFIEENCVHEFFK